MAGVPIKRGKSGALLLEGCLAYLECRLTEAHEGGDHIICLGEVLDFQKGRAGSLYCITEVPIVVYNHFKFLEKSMQPPPIRRGYKQVFVIGWLSKK